MSYLIIDIGGTYLKVFNSENSKIVKYILEEINGVIKIEEIKKKNY